MSNETKAGQGIDAAELDTLRDQCGALEIAMRNETDAARVVELQRELAECRQRVFEAEEQEREPRDINADSGLSGGTTREHVQIEANGIEAADPEAGPNYAGLYVAERAENDELRHELDEAEQARSSGGRERERVNPLVGRLSELSEAYRTGVQTFGGIYGEGNIYGNGVDLMQAEQPSGHAPELAELAAQHEARLLDRDESFSGEVVQQIEQDQGAAYVIEADGERVMVPSIDGAELDIGDDVQVSRDQQGGYDVEAGYDYGR